MMRSHPPASPASGAHPHSKPMVLERGFRHRLVLESGSKLLASIASPVPALHRLLGKRSGNARKVVVPTSRSLFLVTSSLIEEETLLCASLARPFWGGHAHSGRQGNRVPGEQRSPGKVGRDPGPAAALSDRSEVQRVFPFVLHLGLRAENAKLSTAHAKESPQ